MPALESQPGTKPPAATKPPYHWYELEWLVPYRDAVLALGFCCFVTGVFLIPKFGIQLGLITLGAGLMLAAWRVLVR